MRLLITGGTGLIGEKIIKNKQFTEVTILSRQIKKDHSHFHYINKLSELSDLDNFDIVINLAGEPIVDKRWTKKQKIVIKESRFNTTEKIVQLFHASKTPPKIFISGSAIGVYPSNINQDITENFNFDDINYFDFPMSLCKEWEKIANQVNSKNTRIITLRTGIVLSTEKGALKKMLPAFKLNLGGPLSNGQQFISWIDISDLINAIFFMINNDLINGPVNLTAPNPVTNNDFSKALSSTLNKKNLLRLPSIILKFLMGESSQLLLEGHKVLPDKLTQNGFHFQYDTIDKSLSHLIKKQKG